MSEQKRRLDRIASARAYHFAVTELLDAILDEHRNAEYLAQCVHEILEAWDWQNGDDWRARHATGREDRSVYSGVHVATQK